MLPLIIPGENIPNEIGLRYGSKLEPNWKAVFGLFFPYDEFQPTFMVTSKTFDFILKLSSLMSEDRLKYQFYYNKNREHVNEHFIPEFIVFYTIDIFHKISLEKWKEAGK